MTERMIDELKSFGFMLSDDFVAKVLASANSLPSQKPIPGIMKAETKGEEEEEEEGSSRLNFRNIQEFRTYLLNTDFRRNPPCVAPYLPADALSTQKSMKLTGPVVLQILTVNNIAVASKRRYEDYHTKFLSIVLTDGHTKIHAVEIEPIPGLKPTTPPGSKILFQGGEVIKGKILLTSVNSRFLGGEVKHLIESFQANLHAIKYREMEYGSKGGKQLSRVENPPKFEFDLLLKLQAASSLKPPPVDNRAQKATTENKTKETGPSQQQQNQNHKQINRKDESTQKQESRNQNNKKQTQTNVNNDQIQDNKPQKQNNDKKNHNQQAKANDLPPQESSKSNTTSSNQGQKKESSNQKQEQPKAELVDGAQNNKRERNSNQNQRKHQEKDAGVTKIPANAQSDSHVPKVTEMVPHAQGGQKREKNESRTYTRPDTNNNTEVAARPHDLEDKRKPSNNRRGNEGGKQNSNSNSNSNKVGEAQSSTIALPPPPPTIPDMRASVPENNSRGKNQNNKRSQSNVVPPLAPEVTSSQEKADSHLPQPSAVKEGGRQRDNRNQRNRSDRAYDRKVDDLSQSLASVSIQPVVDTSNPGPNPRSSRLNTAIAKNLISSSLGMKEKQENSMPSQSPNPAPIPVSIAPDRKVGGDNEPQNPDAARGNSRGGRGGNHYRRGGRGGGRGSSEPVQG